MGSGFLRLRTRPAGARRRTPVLGPIGIERRDRRETSKEETRSWAQFTRPSPREGGFCKSLILQADRILTDGQALQPLDFAPWWHFDDPTAIWAAPACRPAGSLSLPLLTCAMLGCCRFGAGVLTGAARQVRDGLLPDLLFFPEAADAAKSLDCTLRYTDHPRDAPSLRLGAVCRESAAGAYRAHARAGFRRQREDAL